MQPFSPAGVGATVGVTASQASQNIALGAMPRTGSFQVRVVNTGTVPANFRFGNPATTATTNDHEALPGSAEVWTVKNSDMNPSTCVAVIAATGSPALQFTTGAGI